METRAPAELRFTKVSRKLERLSNTTLTLSRRRACILSWAGSKALTNTCPPPRKLVKYPTGRNIGPPVPACRFCGRGSRAIWLNVVWGGSSVLAGINSHLGGGLNGCVRLIILLKEFGKTIHSSVDTASGLDTAALSNVSVCGTRCSRAFRRVYGGLRGRMQGKFFEAVKIFLYFFQGVLEAFDAFFFFCLMGGVKSSKSIITGSHLGPGVLFLYQGFVIGDFLRGTGSVEVDKSIINPSKPKDAGLSVEARRMLPSVQGVVLTSFPGALGKDGFLDVDGVLDGRVGWGRELDALDGIVAMAFLDMMLFDFSTSTTSLFDILINVLDLDAVHDWSTAGVCHHCPILGIVFGRFLARLLGGLFGALSPGSAGVGSLEFTFSCGHSPSLPRLLTFLPRLLFLARGFPAFAAGADFEASVGCAPSVSGG
ncbi:hypothetical protein N7510_002017 [Penicillium lagena]|uniref:uncharacterized protein n=1 Tax=Penicillium lagena TaxID=94218 RepID=UPI0025409BAA|nr:uncharacterized protein N7510_002017 [Penicillium lagena]KAJ5625708.1 hypothetical protein N7510_002017 [Penicillium lagena]